MSYYPEDRGGTVYGREPQRPAGTVYGGGAQRPPRPPRERPDPGLPQKPHRSRLGRLLRVLVVVLLLLVVGTAAGVAYFVNKTDKNILRVGDVFGQLPDRPAAVSNGAQNFLLVGADSARKGPPRSDTIMILHLPSDRHGAYIVSVPRDSWVDVPGRGKAKVNASFAWGGPSLLARTIENVSGVHLDHYMQVDFDGFQQMTDAVGGVTVPGAGHLDGKAALKYVRERKSLPRGDFDRIVRQQRFLAALMAKASGSLSDPGALSALADAVSRAVKVDSGFTKTDLMSLGWAMRNVRGDTMEFSTVPTQGTGWAAGQSVVFLDKQADDAVWNALRDDKMAEWKAAQPAK